MTARADVASREPGVLTRLLVRLTLNLAAGVPPRAAATLASFLAAIEYKMSRNRREVVLANLSHMGGAGYPDLARGEDHERIARSIFRSYHRFLLEFLAQRRLTGGVWDDSFRFSGMEMLYAALAQGRGAVIAAAHLGNWELAGLAMARLGFRVHVVTGLQLNRFFHGGIRSLKENSGMLVSTPEDGFIPLIETLRRGGLVVLLVDGDIYTRGIPVRFFGQMVTFPAGPALLARRSGASLLHAHSVRSGSVHHVSFDGAEIPDRSLPLEHDVTRLTGRIAAVQERNIAAHISQWCIFRSFFPGSAAAAYPGEHAA